SNVPIVARTVRLIAQRSCPILSGRPLSTSSEYGDYYNNSCTAHFCYARCAMAGRKRSTVQPYVRIAETFSRQVATDVLRPGDRVPSLRKLSREQGVSLSTALQAYVSLENRGYLEARPQSVFYIRTPYAKLTPEPQAEMLQGQPTA